MPGHGSIIGLDDPILVTGATGFIGSRVVVTLLDRGFRHVRCLARPTADIETVRGLGGGRPGLELVHGTLLSHADCANAVRDVAAVFHLAGSRGEKSVPEAFLNSVVTTRNLLEAGRRHTRLRRFVNIGSFTVYSNRRRRRGRLLDESCPVEAHPELRGDAYCFAKVKQDQLVIEYGRRFGVPYVIVRPGYVYGPGNEGITGRVGIGSFGVFLHLGGSNRLPLTYVDNCAEAIVLAGLRPGIDGEVFNVVDDDLPTSRRFLRLYKQNVRRFTSLYVPHAVSYALCRAWEGYSHWSQGQLPPVFNRWSWHAYWKKTRYSNERVKARLGWTPRVSTAEGLQRYFASCRARARGA